MHVRDGRYTFVGCTTPESGCTNHNLLGVNLVLSILSIALLQGQESSSELSVFNWVPEAPNTQQSALPPNWQQHVDATGAGAAGMHDGTSLGAEATPPAHVRHQYFCIMALQDLPFLPAMF